MTEEYKNGLRDGYKDGINECEPYMIDIMKITDVVRLTQIDFDLTENNIGNAISRKTKYFKATDKLTARGVCFDYIRSLTLKPYLSWNDQVYPQFELRDVVFENKDE